MAAIKNLALLQRGLNAALMPKFRDTPAMWRLLAMLVPSDGANEIYRWLASLPTFREWKGKRNFQNLRDFGFTLENVHYEGSIAINRDAQADDQTGFYTKLAQMLGVRGAQKPDELITNLIEAGDSTVCYDNQYFFDTDHAEGSSGTQSNKLTYAAATGTTPTLAEFEAAFWQAVTAIAGFKDDNGQPWNQIMDLNDITGVVVYVPPVYMEQATKVLGANAVQINNNTTNILSGKGKIVVNPRSTWTDKFAVFKTDGIVQPFIWQERQGMQTEMKDDREDIDIKFMADFRGAAGYGFWQSAVLTTFT